MKQEPGFTLIEVLASLVLVGIIAAFASLFLVVGLEGYEQSRKVADAAMDAEVALQRLSLELKSINAITAEPYTNSSLAYTSSEDSLTGNRAINFDSGNLYITVDGTNYKLIEDVTDPVLTVSLADLDNDTVVDDVAYITVGFTLSGMPAFQVRVYPRQMITKTW